MDTGWQPYQGTEGGNVVNDINSLSHSKWRCQYHIVFAPKYRRKEIYGRLKKDIGNSLYIDDERKMASLIKASLKEGKLRRDVFGLNPLLLGFQTAELAVQEIGLKRDAVIATLLYGSVINGHVSNEQTGAMFGESVQMIIRGLVRIHELYSKSPVQLCRIKIIIFYCIGRPENTSIL